MSQQHIVRGTATSVQTKNGTTDIIYHNTTVVSFNNEKIVLNTGGWKTNTTKTRMNQASNQFELGYNVYQKDFGWFIDYNEHKGIPFDAGSITLTRKTVANG